MNRIVVCLLIALSCFSCRREADYLEQALRLAGDNRPELEKVLAHYRQNPGDSLKYRAAVFLIENMPWHFSYGGKYMDEYVRRIDSCFSDLPIELRMMFYTLPGQYPSLSGRLEIKRDVQNITADYLIHNIDLSFKIWQESYWLRDLYFENFCDYLLPYRLGREPLVFWKDSLPDRFKTKIRDATENLLKTSSDAYSLYTFIDVHLMKDADYFDKQFTIPDANIGKHITDCIGSTTAYTYLWRMCGIPAAVDMLPRHGNANARHCIFSIIDERLRGGVPQEHHNSVAKVYRNTYSANRSQILRPTKDFVPPVARNPFYRDVTASYVRTADVSVNIKTGKHKPEYLYLGVFSMGWDAIAHASVKHGKATFKDMGVGVVYIPFYYIGNRQFFVSNPFYLDTRGERRYFHADINDAQTITIERKYPVADYKIWWCQSFINGKFEASDDEKFTHPKHIFTIKENSYCRKITVPVDSTIQSRYYRFVCGTRACHLAEIHFYDTAGAEVKGKWIGDTTTMGNPWLPNICDEDRLSYSSIESWVGIDFGRKVTLSKIEYMPRNDANGIYPGMNYELLYFDRDKWASMGVQTATGYSITYEKVPRGALLWLRNLTEGKEERIFVYQDGKQRWM